MPWAEMETAQAIADAMSNCFSIAIGFGEFGIETDMNTVGREEYEYGWERVGTP